MVPPDTSSWRRLPYCVFPTLWVALTVSEALNTSVPAVGAGMPSGMPHVQDGSGTIVVLPLPLPALPPVATAPPVPALLRLPEPAAPPALGAPAEDAPPVAVLPAAAGAPAAVLPPAATLGAPALLGPPLRPLAPPATWPTEPADAACVPA